ncbi:MAG TPA: histidine--tRNA ligase [Candidatus Scybalocola faecigallinarum]|uniref:Histidine--tRNA ligase n=1 Tax=Candidatus Scybalocola faecigallinarum TaxID=2840941 RepID=A0A9D1F539_9FIRM|nr:histidine--tRNA ligase [Candidatus Scybalocola faecigallinarum]
MGNKVTPRTLSGFMELLPQEQLKFDKIVRTLQDVYASYGFLPLDTPILESSEVLLAKAGGETEKQIYRFNKGDTDLAMRFDLTVPLAKYVAKNYSSLTFPFKRFQIGKVYRGERAQKGRFREFYQADIDIIGDTKLDIMNDAEVPSIIYNIFTSLGLDDFTIRINNRKVLSGFFEILDLSENVTDILRIVDKIEKIGPDAVAKELEDLGASSEQCREILKFISISGSTQQVIEQLRAYSNKSAVFDAGVDEQEAVANGIAAFNVPEKNYKIDLCIARGLDYYTGTVYETTFNKHPEIGSICSGGRYDNLAEYYTDKKLPGVGISIGLTRLFYILSTMGYLNASAAGPAVLVIPMTSDLSYAIGTATAMRAAGVPAQIYFEQKKFKHKIGYADKLGIPFAAFIGEDEIAAGKVTLKNMTTGEQVTQPLDALIPVILEQLEKSREQKIITVD